MKDQDHHIENLKKSIDSKKAPLSLAKARIAMRSKVFIEFSHCCIEGMDGVHTT